MGLENRGFREEIVKDTFNQLVIQQTLVENLCAKHCCRFWEIKYYISQTFSFMALTIEWELAPHG